MAHVIFLKGINVGGHRRLQPSQMAKTLKAFKLINIGAAGTFIALGNHPSESLRQAIQANAPFLLELMMCEANELLQIWATNPFTGWAENKQLVPFVSVMAQANTQPVETPFFVPNEDDWKVKVLKIQHRFVFGIYKREMKALAALSQLEKMLQTSLTTRNRNTFQKIIYILETEGQ
ncbi:MAG: DUF1697 domain-containing protein [Acidobacteria bacterium]|nr:DUF1697 domain-containing protein [Acidobacteriota bacterium]MCB9399317.1 DUF1697 domain-containing protein [Acidobacteriota bacterium]